MSVKLSPIRIGSLAKMPRTSRAPVLANAATPSIDPGSLVASG